MTIKENERVTEKTFLVYEDESSTQVIGDGKEDRTKYDVVHYAWGGEQVTVPSSNQKTRGRTV